MTRKIAWFGLAASVVGLFVALFALQKEFTMPENFPVLDATEIGTDATPPAGLELATFGSGCFWCTEAVFQQLKGVQKVVSGYSGGAVKNPTYEQVCGGRTGHAEVIQVTFDPAVISYLELLEVFWRSHDPTTLNRQGNDIGTQYRSAVFTTNDTQKAAVERYITQLDAAKVYPDKIVTQVTPLQAFYPAEDYHQDYATLHPESGYIATYDLPKIANLKTMFSAQYRADPVLVASRGTASSR